MTTQDCLKAKNEQESLEALLISIKDGPDAGLAQLHGKTDPDSVRRKLIILLQSERYKEAADSVRGQQPPEEWAELAIQALGLNGEMAEAERVFFASQKLRSRIKCDKCRYTFSELLFKTTFEGQQSGMSISPYAISDTQKLNLARIQDILSPLLSSIRSNKRVELDFEKNVVELAYKVLCLQRKITEARVMAALLFTFKPVPLFLGEAFLGRWTNEIPVGLPERLLSDHPDSFEAKLMASLIMSIYERKSAEAFEIANKLISTAKDKDQKLKLLQVLDVLAQNLDEGSKKFVDEQGLQLLAGNDFELNLRDARKLREAGKTDEARIILEKIRDENQLHWLQEWADLNLESSHGEEALRSLKKVAELSHHPEFYYRAAQVAFNFNKLTDAAELIQKHLTVEPDNLRARSLLAFVYVNMGQHKLAAEEFRVLSTIDPNDLNHLLNQAVSLQSADEPDLSLKVYELLCDSKNPPAQAFIGRAALLKAKNKGEDGFAVLKAAREKYWDDPRFVGAFMDLAHAAQADACGNEALLRLQELQKDGKIEGGLKAVSFDEIKGHIQEFQKRKVELLNFAILGKLPWLLVEQMMGRVPYWGWALRTQPVGWLSEDPLVRAEYSIYSSNCFFVRHAKENGGSLEEIVCSPKGMPICVDLSALITLHRLGLLDRAAAYFGKLMIPIAYVARVLEESSRLVLHQKSQKTSLLEVKKALEWNRINILSDFIKEEKPSIVYVNEYSLDNGAEHSYKLRDIAQVLLREGQISDAKHTEILQVAHKPSAVDAEHPALISTQPIVAELSTLRTLHGVGLLEVFIATFDVHISAEDRDEVLNDVRGLEALEEVYGWHSEMWNKIRSDKRFVQVSHLSRDKRGASEDENDRDIYLSAYLLAMQQNIPVLADDRACQAIALNERPQRDYSSFGTDKVLKGLADEGMITQDELADAYLKLIAWRYRFLVTPSEVLSNFALRHLSNVPGKPLREIARYVHDCMRDAGLFAGFEATDPPASIATRLFLEWEKVIVQFLMDLWMKDSIPEDTLEAITSWTIREFLPSPPRTMGPLKAEIISSLQLRTAIVQSLFTSLHIKDHRRANKALRCIASELGLTRDDYFKLLGEVFDEI